MEEKERQKGIEKTDKKETASTSRLNTSSVSRDGDTSKTDVCSENFDPLLALYSPAVSLPFPNIKCFDNIAQYESFLKGGRGRAKPENVEKKRQKAMKGVADPERIERLKQLMVKKKPLDEEGEGSKRTPQPRRQKPQKNVLTRMTLCKGSPLGELYRCVEERIRVKVHIRTFKGLRGVCSGFIVAFDKFWNMAMVDVDETYREPLLGEALYHEKALTITRLFEKLKLQESSGREDTTTQQSGQGETSKSPPSNLKVASKRLTAHLARERGDGETSDCKTYGKVQTRHVNQLFIRGESILLVNPQPL
ncbi:U7 snRNA-associated Sm-like protein LSm11 [Dunckerocampus dactyliophorus]|uniref:U7 snRNA-associated Sm-like protein LSm11 n=1 Tax=Dunckerocampus dactyliophorus TaxID=161453 RepID=UPI0024060432|nr:U7 snRNA-associated Sm-like protein LSm11 [Dunckerocampus dactyliophorus]